MVVLLLVGIGLVLVLRDGSEESPQANQPPPAPGGVPTAPAADPPADDGPAGGGSGQYVYVEDLCDRVDFSPIFDLLPPSSDPTTGGFDNDFAAMVSCNASLTDGSSFGTMSLNVHTVSDLEFNAIDYEACVDIGLSDFESREEADGPWERGTIAVGPPIADAGAQLCAMDGNLNMDVYFSLSGTAAGNSEMRDAVLEVARDILRVAAG